MPRATHLDSARAIGTGARGAAGRVRRCVAVISTRLHAPTDYLAPLAIALIGRQRSIGRPVRRLMTVGPIWHLGYTVLTRYEGGVVPLLSMRTHLACDAVGALTFLGGGVLLRDQKPAQRLLLAGLGLAELLLIAITSDRPRRGG